MINETNIERAKKLIKECKDEEIIVKSQDEHFNRKILEYGNFDVILDLESRVGKDKLKHIDSGMNNFLAKLAAKKKIALGVDLNEIRQLEGKDKARRIMKIIQNINLARKNKLKIRFLNQKDNINARSFVLSLSGSSKQAKEAISF